jgi:hypothetical protein
MWQALGNELFILPLFKLKGLSIVGEDYERDE